LKEHWGDENKSKEVKWKLILKVGKP
jgi:hypothetical protein